MLDRLAGLESEFRLLEARLADPEVIADQARYGQLARRYSELEPIVAAAVELRTRTDDIAAARTMLEGSTGGDHDFAKEELTSAEADALRLQATLRRLLLPKDPNEGRDVVVEIRGAEGGEEANLWARDLFELYQAFAQRRGWRFEVLGSQASSMGGFDEVAFKVAGDAAWTRMQHEGGTHRVQRVPVTESQGRIHTSSATVAVFPEADEVDVELPDRDLKVDVYRSSGPGGQSVNTTDSAVRITHLPSGLVVSMQDQKSQLQNKAKALVVLRARLLKARQDAAATEASEVRRDQVGAGGRADKIRTYNYKDSRVTDHRVNLTVHKLDRVLAGELEEISGALVAAAEARRLAEGDGDGGSA